MKAIILATLAILAITLAITALFRLRPVRSRAWAMLVVWLLSLPFFLAAFIVTPADLGGLPAGLLIRPAGLDVAAGLLFYGAAFFGGVLQLYNLADRGFSLRILMDVCAAPQGITADEAYSGYSAGKGMGWMYGKRIEGMAATGLTEADGSDIVLTAKGRRTARTFSALRRFLRLPQE